MGETLWERFNQHDPALHGWYYGTIAGILGRDEKLSQTIAYLEYERLVSEVFSRYADPIEQGASDDERLEIRCFYTDTIDDVRRTLPAGTIPCALILDRSDDEEMIELQKMAMVLDAFLRTDSIGFGNVHLVIVNDPDSEDVSWKRKEDGYQIHLCVESGWHWCQVAYQMGYAMMHCLIDHVEKGEQINWAEELMVALSEKKIMLSAMFSMTGKV